MRFAFRPLLSVLVALAALVAGCVAQESASSPQDVDAPDASFGEGQGSIAGQVVDEAQLPIVGAQVGIVEPPVTAVTDEAGAFALPNLEPGEYEVTATALGFQQATQRATVEEGRVTQGIVFTLVALPSDAPYNTVDLQRVELSGMLWKLTPSCIYTDVNPLVKTCGGVRLGGEAAGQNFSCDNCETHYDRETTTLEWQTFVAEVDWTPQSGVSGRGFSYDVNAPNITRGTGGSINQADPKTWVVDTDQPPILIRIDHPWSLLDREIPESDWYPYEDPAGCTAPRPDGIENCDWFWRIFPAHCDLGNCKEGFGPDWGIMYEGVADVYFTMYIREPAPQGYSAVPQE